MPILVNLSDTPPTPVGRGSSAVARGNNVSSHNDNEVAESTVPSSTNSGLLQQYPILDPSQLPLNFSLPTFTSTGLSGNSGFQDILTLPQSISSSNSGASLLIPASQPLSSITSSSSHSSSQPMSVITSHVLPVLPPYPQFNLSSTASDLNSSDFSFLFSDNVS